MCITARNAKQINNKAIEEAREKMHTSINVNGRVSPATIKLSQELDKLLIKEQLRRMSG